MHKMTRFTVIVEENNRLYGTTLHFQMPVTVHQILQSIADAVIARHTANYSAWTQAFSMCSVLNCGVTQKNGEMGMLDLFLNTLEAREGDLDLQLSCKE